MAEEPDRRDTASELAGTGANILLALIGAAASSPGAEIPHPVQPKARATVKPIVLPSRGA